MAVTTELAFKAQLVIPEQRQIFDYWMSRTKEGQLPSRGDINPCDFPRLLPLISLIDVDLVHKRFRVRLAGTQLREHYGRDITGIHLDEVDYGTKTDYWLSAFHRVAYEGRPAQGIVRGCGEDKQHLAQFWIKLPLSEDGKNVSMILSYDVFLPVSQARTISSPDQVDPAFLPPDVEGTAGLSRAL